MDPRPSPQQLQPSFSPVKVLVPHQPPQGSLSQTPFLQSSVPSGQAGPQKAVEMVRVQASLAFFNRLFIVPNQTKNGVQS